MLIIIYCVNSIILAYLITYKEIYFNTNERLKTYNKDNYFLTKYELLNYLIFLFLAAWLLNYYLLFF